jgi:hypothetical protein
MTMEQIHRLFAEGKLTSAEAASESMKLIRKKGFLHKLINFIRRICPFVNT